MIDRWRACNSDWLKIDWEVRQTWQSSWKFRPRCGRSQESKPAWIVEAATVGDALKQLTVTFADLRKHLYMEDGRIRSFVNIYVNDEDIRYLQKENTPIKDGDTISIVPSIAGGHQS